MCTGEDLAVEYFMASDASAVVEHTKRVIFLEDDDVAFVQAGNLTIHRLKKGSTNALTRSIHVSVGGGERREGGGRGREGEHAGRL